MMSIVAGSGAEMLDRLVTLSRPPDLILCDYRLRDNENGISAVKRLQSRYAERVPAVLITGDTAPDRPRRRGRAVWSCCINPLRRSSSGRRSGT